MGDSKCKDPVVGIDLTLLEKCLKPAGLEQRKREVLRSDTTEWNLESLLPVVRIPLGKEAGSSGIPAPRNLLLSPFKDVSPVQMAVRTDGPEAASQPEGVSGSSKED